MHHFQIYDPTEGLGEVLRELRESAVYTNSRNGRVARFPGPVALEYEFPQRRILEHPVREANHFFHLFESIWMLAGLNTVAPLDPFNSGMKQYSDDGVTFAAAYGDRWRVKWGDQISAIIYKLVENPLDRRIVLQMWDPMEIFKNEGLDFACNQQVLFSTREEGGRLYLDIAVTNRSNDIIYGAMGSNLFHFSLLQEYIAYHAGLAVGRYVQFSVNMHLYMENPASKKCWDNMDLLDSSELISDETLTEYGLPINVYSLRRYVNEYHVGPEDDYLSLVVKPVADSYLNYKDKSIPLDDRLNTSIGMLEDCHSIPLRIACTKWFERRRK